MFCNLISWSNVHDGRVLPLYVTHTLDDGDVRDDNDGDVREDNDGEGFEQVVATTHQSLSFIIITATTIATTTHYDSTFHDRNKVIVERAVSQCSASDEELLSEDGRASTGTGGAAAGAEGAVAGAGGASSPSDSLVALFFFV